ncbi:unnamed protein product [Bursaphelenchus okinawaensis]|uniref:Cyclin-like domain-containing protein n=1 Tax=Bursaphelenchus okinawaensis TaxID=465554 RepID=A0A811JUE5_9BILA|nr:unnamed protein product [Bursaphelenchus okinawaensis]CAG9083710.1 unnamed protein product [Bursaphelenchus okinawaensis]
MSAYKAVKDNQRVETSVTVSVKYTVKATTRPSKRMSTLEVFESDENVSPERQVPKKTKRKRPVASRSMPNILNTSQEFGAPVTFWDVLVQQDIEAKTSPIVFRQHPGFKPQMRLVLFDWIMNVCSELNLHRETFYLTITYIDKYLSITGAMPEREYKVKPDNLQLLGVTCLFIACKVEEIYPPKLEVLSDYTNGACSSKQIRDMETAILEVLDWNCVYMSPVQWLAFYLQMMYKQDKVDRDNSVAASTSNELSEAEEQIHDDSAMGETFTVPVLARDEFVLLVRGLDLIMSNTKYMNFTYGELAAAVILHSYEPTENVEEIIGYTRSQLSRVLRFIEPYMELNKSYESNAATLPPRRGDVKRHDLHNIQTPIPHLEELVSDLLDGNTILTESTRH